MLSHRSKKLKAKGVAEGKRRVAILEPRKALPFPEQEAAPAKKAKLKKFMGIKCFQRADGLELSAENRDSIAQEVVDKLRESSR